MKITRPSISRFCHFFAIRSSIWAVVLALTVLGMGCASSKSGTDQSADTTMTETTSTTVTTSTEADPMPVETSSTMDGSQSNGAVIDYVVKSGDSLWKIAHEHQTTVRKIREMNNLSADATVIRPGMTLKVVDNRSAASSTTTTTTTAH